MGTAATSPAGSFGVWVNGERSCIHSGSCRVAAVLQRRWPLATTRDALSIGAIWVLLSVLFEFGFGHCVEGDSWGDLLQNYDLGEGNLWLLILLWIAAGPAIVRALAGKRCA